MLNVNDHRRDSAGLKYIYPVISRRAGGVSVGINLNTNNACNWACMYCQVPNLTRGGPPPIDIDQLESELRFFLHEIIHGDYLETNAPPEARHLVDIAFSGNGEPTSAADFPEIVERAGKVMQELPDLDVCKNLKLRLITNGSLMHRPAVRLGIKRLGELGGEVWFKLDRGTEAGIQQVNGTKLNPENIASAVAQCAACAPTWIQSCFFAIDGLAPDETEIGAYLALLVSIRDKIEGVHLYGLARPSMQREKARLSALPTENLALLSRKIAALGIRAIVSP